MILHAIDSPQANGRLPQPGDTRWSVTIPLDNDESVTVFMGRKSRDIIFGMLIADTHDNGEEEPNGS